MKVRKSCRLSALGFGRGEPGSQKECAGGGSRDCEFNEDVKRPRGSQIPITYHLSLLNLSKYILVSKYSIVFPFSTNNTINP